MRHPVIAAALVAAVPLAAQEANAPPRAAAPLPFTITGEIPAALDGRYVINLEPAVFGRWSLGVRASYSTEPPGASLVVAAGLTW
ncbi:MAG TPA: hypothetical protein VNL98_05690 [Gemmatimonadales bacterium]|nr:hypothetical protein [Gemmatimonadales bacterium]